MTCKCKVFCEQGDTCVAHEGYDILKCTAFKEKGTLTNEEWLRQATTEQLAGFLSKVGELDEAPIPCGDLMECSKKCGLYSQCAGDDAMPTNEEIWVEWLKQPHTTTKE